MQAAIVGSPRPLERGRIVERVISAGRSRDGRARVNIFFESDCNVALIPVPWNPQICGCAEERSQRAPTNAEHLGSQRGITMLIVLPNIHRTRRCLPPQTKRDPKTVAPYTPRTHRRFSREGHYPRYTPAIFLSRSLTRNTGDGDAATATIARVRPPTGRGDDSRRDDNWRRARSWRAWICTGNRTRCRHNCNTATGSFWCSCVQKRSSVGRSGRVHGLTGLWFAGFQSTLLGQVALVHRADVSLEIVNAEEAHPAGGRSG